MGQTLNLGQRIELCSIDAHFHEISLALYYRVIDGDHQVTVHSYSQIEGTADRMQFILQALVNIVGLVPVPNDENWLHFECGSFHKKAVQRCFLDLCKNPSDAELSVKPLQAFDKKAKCDLVVNKLGDGRYQMSAAEETDTGAKRAKALSVGYEKVCQMQLDEENCMVAFPCNCDHDAMMGMMLFRAQNVRAAMREEADAASRGVLAPPSQQE